MSAICTQHGIQNKVESFFYVCMQTKRIQVANFDGFKKVFKPNISFKILPKKLIPNKISICDT
jgi:hypothetical protein